MNKRQLIDNFMNTILFLGNTYITSLDQLYQILPSYLSPEMPIYDEILTLFMDGILEKWLEKGDAESKKIANGVNRIEKEQSNSKIMEQLIASLPVLKNKKIVLNKPDILKYLPLKKVVCKVNSEEIDIQNGRKITVDSKSKDNVLFEFFFSIDKIENESFEMQLIDNGREIIRTFNIDLKSSSKREIRIDVPVSFTDGNEHNLTLNSDERQLFYTRVFLSKSKKEEVSSVELNSLLKEETIAVNGVNFKMIHVKGGTFMMGATKEQDNEAWGDEYPVHEVTLSDFSIGKMQVTQELWNAVMNLNPSDFEGDKLPVENVSWDDCQEFIRKLNAITKRKFRLPTEAEWEYAARGGNKSKGYKYAGSNSIGDVAWSGSNSGGRTHEVGLKHPNELGLYDMSGNVWEWCNDWYNEYSSESQTNSTGPSSGSSRVFRGGSWGDFARRCRVSYRDRTPPGGHNINLGLRLAL